MKLYVSHAEKDSGLAQELIHRLQGAGLEVFDLYHDVLPGDLLATRLAEALRAADWVVVLLTPGSGRSPSVRSETQFVLVGSQFRDRVIPVVFAPNAETEVEVPWILRRLPGHYQVGEPDLDLAVQEIRTIVDRACVAAD